MGNPIGQTRAVKRFRERAGPLLLDLQLETGKRGKYKLIMVTWEVWDPETEDMTKAKHLLPPRACLAVGFNQDRGRGWPEGPKGWRAITPFIVSRHACLRLAMRAEVRTVPDLLVAVRELWDTVSSSVHEKIDEEWWAKAPIEGYRWLMPRGTIAVVGQYNDDHRLIVKTILD